MLPRYPTNTRALPASRELNDWGSEHDQGVTFGDDLPSSFFARAAVAHTALRQRLLHGAVRDALHAAAAGTTAAPGPAGSAGGWAVPQSPLVAMQAVGVHTLESMVQRLKGDRDVDPVWDTDPDEEMVGIGAEAIRAGTHGPCESGRARVSHTRTLRRRWHWAVFVVSFSSLPLFVDNGWLPVAFVFPLPWVPVCTGIDIV
jgi:hypothetical protein